jgi:hypothetical protein
MQIGKRLELTPSCDNELDSFRRYPAAPQVAPPAAEMTTSVDATLKSGLHLLPAAVALPTNPVLFSHELPQRQ